MIQKTYRAFPNKDLGNSMETVLRQQKGELIKRLKCEQYKVVLLKEQKVDSESC
jgi:hypothetical protein